MMMMVTMIRMTTITLTKAIAIGMVLLIKIIKAKKTTIGHEKTSNNRFIHPPFQAAENDIKLTKV